MIFFLFLIILLQVDPEVNDKYTNWYVVAMGVFTIISNVATGFISFLLTSKKNKAEVGKTSVDTLNILQTAYYKALESETKMADEKRQLERQLDKCVDDNQGCVDCMAMVKRFVETHASEYKTSDELRTALQVMLDKENK